MCMYVYVLKFHAKIKDQFVIHDITVTYIVISYLDVAFTGRPIVVLLSWNGVFLLISTNVVVLQELSWVPSSMVI